jgi:hypothetical protein
MSGDFENLGRAFLCCKMPGIITNDYPEVATDYESLGSYRC